MLKILTLIILIYTSSLPQAIKIPPIEFSPQKYICYYSDQSLNINGRLDESVWKDAEWTDYFVDIKGPSQPHPRYNTRVKMLWDEKYFYVGAELEEPDIWGMLENHDDTLFYDNNFEVFIDPDGDTGKYCELEINALNTIWDLLLIKPYRDIENAAVTSWKFKGLKSGVAVYGTLNNPDEDDSCWTVELAFPWEIFKELSDVSIPPKDKDQWRINFARVEWKIEISGNTYKKQINPATKIPYPMDVWVWSPQGIMNMHYPEMWGYVQFSSETAGRKKTEFINNNQEPAKWFLRQIYYRQKNYFADHKKFTNNLSELNIQNYEVPGYKMPPVLESTTESFNAFLESSDGSEKIYIKNDGITWSIQKKK